MSNQSGRQAYARAISGLAAQNLTYEGDWHAAFDTVTIPAVIPKGLDFNGRLLLYINGQLSTSYVDLDGAMAAWAISRGARSWNEWNGT